MESDTSIYAYIGTYAVFFGGLIAGVVWIIYRIKAYVRNERDREARWAHMASNEDFRSFLQDLSAKSAAKTSGTPETPGKDDPRPFSDGSS
ncbi:hypothetical protein ACFL2Q_16305 [Thermodesulfobacteriota bacterium]